MPVVLVVDDQPLLLDLLCEMLADLSCEAVSVNCPVKGLEKIASHERIAMLITDIQMPIMDGFELADRAREKRPDLPHRADVRKGGRTSRIYSDQKALLAAISRDRRLDNPPLNSCRSMPNPKL